MADGHAWTAEFLDCSAIVALAAMAQSTSRIRVGSAIAYGDPGLHRGREPTYGRDRRMIDAIGGAGTAEQVRAGVERPAADFDHVALYAPSFTLSIERVRESMRAFIDAFAPGRR